MPWDNQLAKTGIKVWLERKIFFEKIIKQQKQTEKIITKTDKYDLKYSQPKTDKIKEYIDQLNFNKKQLKTIFGPHQDNVFISIKKSPLQDYGSQGEKKLFRYLLKIAEAEILYAEKETKPILLLDDFFAKLDEENIMKIFTFFHCKFQAIITTTTTKETAMEKLIKKERKNNHQNNKT